MVNKRADALEMRVRIETGDVKPMHLGVTLPHFKEWALPYILIKDDDTNWAGWHEIEGLARVCHIDELAEWEKRPVQFPIDKPLRNAQTYTQPPRSASYRTVSLPVWQDAYRLLDQVGFLEDDFCTPLGVYVTSLLHGVRECEGGGGRCLCPTWCSPCTYRALCPEGTAGSCEAVCPWPGPSEAGQASNSWRQSSDGASPDLTLVETGGEEHFAPSMD